MGLERQDLPRRRRESSSGSAGPRDQGVAGSSGRPSLEVIASRLERNRARRNRAAALGVIVYGLRAIAAGIGLALLVLVGAVIALVLLVVIGGLLLTWLTAGQR